MTLSQKQRDALERLRLAHPPVAVAFLPAPPQGLAHIGRPLPAGCSYWKEASDGRAFYTTAADHQNCPVGAFTHGVTLSPEKAAELTSLLGTMVELRYIRSDEVPSIPHRTSPMEVAAYAPLGSATFEPDLVVFRGNARQIMLMAEAARSAGVFDAATAMGRPACAMLPQATGTGAGVASVACIGNRVYTELGDDELYFAVPGQALTLVLEQLRDILDANRALETFHRQRAAALGA